MPKSIGNVKQGTFTSFELFGNSKNKIDFVNLIPIFQEERDLKLADIEEFSKRVFADRENDIFLFDPKRDSFAKDIEKFTKNKKDDSLDMED